MDEDREIARLHKVFRTIRELVRDRGYLVSTAELEMSLDEFRETYSKNRHIDRQSLIFAAGRENDENDKLLVFFAEDESVGIKPIKRICERMIVEGVVKGILIYQKQLTPSANKVVQELAPKYQLELFMESELLVNITKHTLVPDHEVLTVEEKKTLLARYRLKETQLPRIQRTDPIARYYGLQRGQVVKIIRPSETAGKYVTYRLCW
ncbi:RNA polymerase Rpb5, C-terminal domain-containing protein [Polychytrium aggregatum]|uniref:RNA polymerase Rpb5, C-terminal domain-containing protein n=1 Tax=Polychytrium aggregatum TaxID=110093 RepID=UPI0022FEADEE|nr:RNA polymerase Rpb5, C-terminal domain-containing protein [Polychytrium aggregatum]KAI9208673.1 RNA polymerase Rpb5, C-terminal domain-containing protein [Polychytrium aggregatum]